MLTFEDAEIRYSAQGSWLGCLVSIMSPLALCSCKQFRHFPMFSHDDKRNPYQTPIRQTLLNFISEGQYFHWLFNGEEKYH